MTSQAGAFAWRGAPRSAFKVVDGRPVNGHFWLFAAALSPFETTLTVRDRTSDTLVDLFQPAGARLSLTDFGALPPLPDERDGLAPTADPAAPEGALAATAPAEEAQSCAAGPRTLCLAGGRFRVEVSRQRTGGGERAGRALPVGDDTGALSLFAPSDPELVVRVADGRPVNGRFWVLVGGLTDRGYTLTVTDTVTGVARRYRNPAGRLASYADLRAFTP